MAMAPNPATRISPVVAIRLVDRARVGKAHLSAAQTLMAMLHPQASRRAIRPMAVVAAIEMPAVATVHPAIIQIAVLAARDSGEPVAPEPKSIRI